jgi:hypothetical protein
MWPDTPIHSSLPAHGIRGHMMEISAIYAEELPGFPAMNGSSRAIRRAVAKADDLLYAVSAETSQGLGKGF